MVGVQVVDVLAQDVAVYAICMESDGISRPSDYLKRLQLSTFLQVGRVNRKEPVDEAVRLLGKRIRGSRLAAYVFNDHQISPAVGLDAFESSAAKDSGNIFDFGWD